MWSLSLNGLEPTSLRKLETLGCGHPELVQKPRMALTFIHKLPLGLKVRVVGAFISHLDVIVLDVFIIPLFPGRDSGCRDGVFVLYLKSGNMKRRKGYEVLRPR